MARAGLTASSVTEAGAMLADEIGFEKLSMNLLADRLGVKTPSLYKHVAGQADLTYRIAVLATTELADAIRDATQGRAGADALVAATWAMRRFIHEHAGRYAAAEAVRTTATDDPLNAAKSRMLETMAAVLRGYELDPGQEIHALRLLRSLLHGFATLEVAGGFTFDTDIGESFSWIVNLINDGLKARRRQTPLP